MGWCCGWATSTAGALNVVDDQPTLVHDWLPEMAAMTGLAGAANTRARQALDWQPTYSGWRDGLRAGPDCG